MDTCVTPRGRYAGQVCSGHGTCQCGECRCHQTEEAVYSGRYCQECPVRTFKSPFFEKKMGENGKIPIFNQKYAHLTSCFSQPLKSHKVYTVVELEYTVDIFLNKLELTRSFTRRAPVSASN